jgi:hypothetical protein
MQMTSRNELVAAVLFMFAIAGLFFVDLRPRDGDRNTINGKVLAVIR